MVVGSIQFTKRGQLNHMGGRPTGQLKLAIFVILVNYYQNEQENEFGIISSITFTNWIESNSPWIGGA